MSVPILNILARHGLTLADVAGQPEEAVRRLGGVGGKTARDLRELLVAAGLPGLVRPPAPTGALALALAAPAAHHARPAPILPAGVAGGGAGASRTPAPGAQPDRCGGAALAGATPAATRTAPEGPQEDPR